MDIQHVQKALENQGYKKSSALLITLEKSDKKLEVISRIFEDCHVEEIELSDDIRILYAQVRALSQYDEAFQEILVRDVQYILQEVVSPTDDFATIFMDEDELQEVITLYEKAMLGESEAQLSLGKFYKTIERDDIAFAWYEAAANAGNTDAIYWLGNYYFDGIVVEKNWEKTFSCYKKAALMGHPDAMNNYADMYFRGEYVEKDNKRAFELFSLAARKGVMESMYTLGYLYENGIGTEVDLEKSKHWYTQSALDGDVYAANRLGHDSVEEGRGEEAIRWYKMAADRQDVYGEFNLGMCYENGIGTPVNLKKAKHWYQKAALKGDTQAKEKLKRL